MEKYFKAKRIYEINIMGINKTLLFCLLWMFPFIIKGQSLKHEAAVDSNYHNYLYDNRLAYFNGLPAAKGGIVFLGNSITHWGDWAELFKNAKVRNRGIAGDISFGVLARLDEITASNPEKIFIMIGVNDIGRKIPTSYTIRNYEKILLQLKNRSKRTRIFMQSILPINDSLINRKYYTGTNTEIRNLNEELKKLALKHTITYIELHSLFTDASGQMLAKYTYDGIHLTAEGYLLWINYLKKKRYCN